MSQHPSRRFADRLRRVTRGDVDAGFTLIEVIVSFVIFAVIAGGATAAIVSALNVSHTSQQRVDAANVAQSFIADAQRNPGSATAETDKAFGPVGVKNESFDVTRTITFSDGGSSCSTGVSMTVHVKVTQAQNGHFLARSDTVVAC